MKNHNCNPKKVLEKNCPLNQKITQILVSLACDQNSLNLGENQNGTGNVAWKKVIKPDKKAKKMGFFPGFHISGKMTSCHSDFADFRGLADGPGNDGSYQGIYRCLDFLM